MPPRALPFVLGLLVPTVASAAVPFQDPSQPTGWVSLGAYVIEDDYDTSGEPDVDPAFGLEVGLIGWTGEVGLGLEAAVMRSSFDVATSSIDSETVDTTRWMIGLRIADWNEGSRFSTYLRGGFLYRTDEGDLVDDDGSGFYAGLGVDVRIAGPLAISPQVLYTDSSSLDATEWLFGGSLVWRF
jgi:hypothetical protein